jgi:hypothetical protein
MKTFKQWYSNIHEDLEAEPTVKTDVDVKNDTTTNHIGSNKNDIMQDVDNIINSLEVLSTELTESLNTPDEVLISEKDGLGTKVIDFMIKAPKARKSQGKVNKMNLKIANLEAAANNAEGEAKQKIKDKVSQLKDQAKELQQAVEDKYKDSSKIVKSALSSEKIKGKLQVLKTTTGDKDSKDMKKQVDKLQKRLKAEEDAFKSAEPSNDQKKELKQQIKDKQNESVSVKDILINRANRVDLTKLANEINTKEEWQLSESSMLYQKYNAQITKTEYTQQLNESKYTVNSIRDKFSSLI